jgi:hypothetical protein
MIAIANGMAGVRGRWCVVGIVWAIVVTALVVNAARRVGGDTGDFHAFFNASQALVRGESPYTAGDGTYIYPPLLAFLYTPLAGLSQARAEVVALCVNVGLLLAAVFLATREFARRFDITLDARAAFTVALAAVLLTADKLKGELQMWQTNVLLLFLFTAAFRLLDRRPGLAGAALGFAFNIKYWPVVLLPQLLLRRRWVAAGAFVAGMVAFALLPATLSGWNANLHNQATAYRGLGRTVTGHDGPAPAANVPELVCRASVSITTVMARLAGPDVPTGVPLAAVALIVTAAAVGAAWMYRRNGVSFLYRQDGVRPDDRTARVMTGLEWAGLLTAVLLFSPQTNTRHLCLLLFVNTAAVLLLLFPRPGVPRRALLLGTITLALGLILPPGGQSTFQRLGDWCHPACSAWSTYGGPSWCAAVMFGTLLFTGLRYMRALAAVRPTWGN